MGVTRLWPDWGQYCNAQLALSGGARLTNGEWSTARYQPQGAARLHKHRNCLLTVRVRHREDKLAPKHASETCPCARQRHPEMWAQNPMGTSWSLGKTPKQQMKEWEFLHHRHRQHTHAFTTASSFSSLLQIHIKTTLQQMCCASSI